MDFSSAQELGALTFFITIWRIRSLGMYKTSTFPLLWRKEISTSKSRWLEISDCPQSNPKIMNGIVNEWFSYRSRLKNELSTALLLMHPRQYNDTCRSSHNPFVGLKALNNWSVLSCLPSNGHVCSSSVPFFPVPWSSATSCDSLALIGRSEGDRVEVSHLVEPLM